jgi:hypothetical protein
MPHLREFRHLLRRLRAPRGLFSLVPLFLALRLDGRRTTRGLVPLFLALRLDLRRRTRDLAAFPCSAAKERPPEARADAEKPEEADTNAIADPRGTSLGFCSPTDCATE